MSISSEICFKGIALNGGLRLNRIIDQTQK